MDVYIVKGGKNLTCENIFSCYRFAVNSSVFALSSSSHAQLENDGQCQASREELMWLATVCSLLQFRLSILPYVFVECFFFFAPN